MGASVLSFTLPYASNIAWKRACIIKSHGMKKPTTRTSSERSSSKPAALDKDSENTFDRLKEAGDAAIMSKMFDSLGQQDKALEIDRGILSLFKSDDEYSWETGYNSYEKRSLGPKELEVVVSTLIDSARHWNDLYLSRLSDPNKEDTRNLAILTCYFALNIFKEAPAKKLLKDRSFVFPGYSLMVALLKGGASMPPNKQTLEEAENEVAISFVEETSFQQYHHGRSLAIKADIMRKYGRYEDAVSAIDEMKLVYEPSLHTKVISRDYVTDHCAEILAASVSWLCYLNRKEEALRLCDYIIEQILPEIGEREFLSLNVILYPICLCFKEQGGKRVTQALELYEKHIIHPTEGEKRHPIVANMIIPMIIILNFRSSDGVEYDSIKDDIAYMLNEEDEKYPAWFEAAVVSYIDFAFSTIFAEACLCLSRMDACDKLESDALIKEGYRYLDISEATLKREDGSVTSAVAYSYYSRVLSGFKEAII